jgi:hypothetical protein
MPPQGSSFADRLYSDAIFSYKAFIFLIRPIRMPHPAVLPKFVDANTQLAYTALGSGEGKCRIKNSYKRPDGVNTTLKGTQDELLDALMCKNGDASPKVHNALFYPP